MYIYIVQIFLIKHLHLFLQNAMHIKRCTRNLTWYVKPSLLHRQWKRRYVHSYQSRIQIASLHNNNHLWDRICSYLEDHDWQRISLAHTSLYMYLLYDAQLCWQHRSAFVIRTARDCDRYAPWFTRCTTLYIVEPGFVQQASRDRQTYACCSDIPFDENHHVAAAAVQANPPLTHRTSIHARRDVACQDDKMVHCGDAFHGNDGDCHCDVMIHVDVVDRKMWQRCVDRFLLLCAPHVRELYLLGSHVTLRPLYEFAFVQLRVLHMDRSSMYMSRDGPQRKKEDTPITHKSTGIICNDHGTILSHRSATFVPSNTTSCTTVATMILSSSTMRRTPQPHDAPPNLLLPFAAAHHDCTTSQEGQEEQEGDEEEPMPGHALSVLMDRQQTVIEHVYTRILRWPISRRLPVDTLQLRIQSFEQLDRSIYCTIGIQCLHVHVHHLVRYGVWFLVRQHASTLRELVVMEEHDRNRPWSEEQCRMAQRVLSACCVLRHLDLPWCNIGKDRYTQWFQQLEHLSGLGRPI